MKRRVHLGISTCPNDTFAFHGILTGAVSHPALDVQIDLRDVQELNKAFAAGEFDIAKGSFYAALMHSDSLWVLPSGSALGFGVGPLLLAAGDKKRPVTPSTPSTPLVLCPGEHTTAHLLYRLFHAGEGQVEQRLFSEIMPALEAGQADLGVCIHEGRFTWRERGLELVEDLGTRWEADCGHPLPLGGLFARRSAGIELARDMQQLIRDSIEYAHANRDEAALSMRRYAAEQSDEVLYAHVDLYVNEWTLDLGEIGESALAMLSERARSSALLAPDQPGLEILPR
ncbi:MAG: 1,4-dihydroxy-6-naphthoate synthase [Planctomycetota bacterium]|jgi:1,4-dihydroxy-6-naphthoate synthase